MGNNEKKKGLLGSAAIMGVIILISKLLGLFRDILVANFYGSTMEAVAYEAASRLPVTIFDLVIGGVVTSAFIPVFNGILVRRGKADAMNFANKYLNLIIYICVAIAIVGVIFAEGLLTLIAPDISSEAASLAATLTRIMFPMIIFTGIAFSFVGILQSMGEYNLPAVISLVSNSIMVVYLFTLNRFFGIVGLAAAMLIGWAAQATVQAPKAYSFGFSYRPKIKIFDKDILHALKNALPILIGTWTTPICSLINTRFASGIENGRAMTAMGYANRLYIMIVGIFSFVATNLLFPYFSKAQAEGDKSGAEKLVKISVKTLVYIIAPITVGIIVLAEPFCAVVYQRGEFTSFDTSMTAAALTGYALGMVFMAINEVIVKAIFAADKPRLPMISSLVSMVFNIALVTVLASRLGIFGIALASAAATALNVLVNLIFAYRIGVCRFTLRDTADIVVSVISAVIMALPVYFVSTPVSGALLKIIVSVAAAVPVYFVLSFILRSEEAKFIASPVIRKIKK